MADEEAINGGNGAGDLGDEPQVVAIAQYIKDLSVESPNAPQAFQWQSQPQLDVQFNIAAGKIAAAQGGGVRDSSNLTALEATRVSKGFETSLTALVTGNATAYKQKNTIADAQAAIRDGAATTLSAATGVNLDAEAVDLMRFQQAYAASGRVIQVARETMDEIEARETREAEMAIAAGSPAPITPR